MRKNFFHLFCLLLLFGCSKEQINQLNLQNNQLSSLLTNAKFTEESLKAELDKANEENKNNEVMIEQLKEQQDQNLNNLRSLFEKITNIDQSFTSDSKLELNYDEKKGKDVIQALSLIKLPSIKRV